MTQPEPRRFHFPFWRLVALLVLACGIYATWVRFTKGLGASTNLTDAYPWGIWIGFDILCGVGLAAGGFAITTAVYILHLERFRPIVRPTVLTAYLGYLLVVCGLMFDLGRPWAIWHAIIMWNPHSVMFEVAWCVMLYNTVLTLEFAPVLFEKLGWTRPLKVIKAIVVPLVALGFLLSTLHQSSLGSLYLILPSKLHPLWYSPILPVLFWISALSVGLAMIIFESGLSARAFGHALQFDLLQSISKGMAAALLLTIGIRFGDLAVRGSLHHAFNFSSNEAGMFWLEILLWGTGLVMALKPKVRSSPKALWASSIFVVGGFLVNRLNVSLTALEQSAKVRYIPSFYEVAVTASIVVAGFVIFNLAVRYLPVFHPKDAAPELHA